MLKLVKFSPKSVLTTVDLTMALTSFLHHRSNSLNKSGQVSNQPIRDDFICGTVSSYPHVDMSNVDTTVQEQINFNENLGIHDDYILWNMPQVLELTIPVMQSVFSRSLAVIA